MIVQYFMPNGQTVCVDTRQTVCCGSTWTSFCPSLGGGSGGVQLPDLACLSISGATGAYACLNGTYQVSHTTAVEHGLDLYEAIGVTMCGVTGDGFSVGGTIEIVCSGELGQPEVAVEVNTGTAFLLLDGTAPTTESGSPLNIVWQVTQPDDPGTTITLTLAPCGVTTTAILCVHGDAGQAFLPPVTPFPREEHHEQARVDG